MAWLTTWPLHGIPTYREHPTELAAKEHAESIVRQGVSSAATYFEIEETA